ncbi:hypothetical protein GE21DRAFT_1900 [Neurospora crassa]|uniref:Uncharacterized protein n=1 Tax=Neurospora crassa (strain ATCC 24698 / 74-OR23-1A / CBS 708.71 / DSM 1257 / FGSC 987) TaxID=367110 RepID=Q7SEC7_NEUCR|nr:hypothetical protein NCU00807 [Neurospora crassa OR74A]EAA35114.1 hypothetical protein NCU00807 [Neurospora crassa OR74A]KHE79819.1 hypothetical protein GE21DRAFT_1900 [Neurospora crassa]|eukprot:XP_964350.1 hypothetical protein NCU00807 [Neurospora crassa OR74A]
MFTYQHRQPEALSGLSSVATAHHHKPGTSSNVGLTNWVSWYYTRRIEGGHGQYRESYIVIKVRLCAAETETLVLSIAGEKRLPKIAQVMSSEIFDTVLEGLDKCQSYDYWKLRIDNALRTIG